MVGEFDHEAQIKSLINLNFCFYFMGKITFQC